MYGIDVIVRHVLSKSPLNGPTFSSSSLLTKV